MGEFLIFLNFLRLIEKFLSKNRNNSCIITRDLLAHITLTEYYNDRFIKL